MYCLKKCGFFSKNCEIRRKEPCSLTCFPQRVNFFFSSQICPVNFHLCVLFSERLSFFWSISFTYPKIWVSIQTENNSELACLSLINYPLRLYECRRTVYIHIVVTLYIAAPFPFYLVYLLSACTLRALLSVVLEVADRERHFYTNIDNPAWTLEILLTIPQCHI